MSFSDTPTSQDVNENQKPAQPILCDSFGAAMGSKAAEHLDSSKQWGAPSLTTPGGKQGNNAVSNKPVPTEVLFHFLFLLWAEIEHY